MYALCMYTAHGFMVHLLPQGNCLKHAVQLTIEAGECVVYIQLVDELSF